MRIVLLADARSLHTQRWGRFLASRKHDVHVISFRAARIEGTKVHHIHSRVPTKLKYLASIPRIKRLLQVIQPEVVNAHYATSYGLIAVRASAKRLVLSVWGSDVYVATRFYPMRCVVRHVVRRVDRITTTSQEMATVLTTRYGVEPEKIRTFSWGVDTTVFCPGYKDEAKSLRQSMGIAGKDPVVVSNRHMHPLYQIGTIIRAIPAVRDVFPQTHFVFLRGCVDDRYENQMKAMVERLGVKSRTHFLSRILEPRELAILLNTADFFISIPSFDQRSTSVLEGLACGVIPVLANLPVYREVVQDAVNGFLISSRSSESLANTLIHAIQTLPALKEKFARHNVAYIQNHERWTVNAQKMEHVYREILHGKNPHHA